MCIEQTDLSPRIKQAYRKKALELHPDRNYGNIEATTKQFAEVQSAYEVLSDPQERTWYDSHREIILQNEKSAAGDCPEDNIPVTTAADILQIFGKVNAQVDFTNSATGFYSILGDIFDKVAREEQVACDLEGFDRIEYPCFGQADDNFEDTVRPFYAIWTGFATQKTFSWKDIYRYSEAPDRRIRRLMEKENKRLRGDGIREFNEAVRSLIAFVKKRDPRFKLSLRSEAKREEVLKHAASAQAARSRAANQVKEAPASAIPEWMRSSEPQESERTDEKVPAPPREEFECVVCQKTFKSENQYEAHEKSKKHLKAVQRIRKEIRRDHKDLDLDESTVPSVTKSTPDTTDGGHDVPEHVAGGQALEDSVRPGNESEASKQNPPPVPESNEPFSHREIAQYSPAPFQTASQDAHVSGTTEEIHVLGSDFRNDSQSSISDDGVDEMLEPLPIKASANDEKRKLGKAKEKRARKTAQKASIKPDSRAEFQCAACQAGFSSNTRLFTHIKNVGHAQAVPLPVKGGKGKKR